MKKIRKGDEVIVIAGKDKGKRGQIKAIIEQGTKVIVADVNLAKKHIKGNPNTGTTGGIVKKEMPIHRSNVMVYDPNANKGSRIGIRILNDGKKVRYFKASDQLVEAKE